MCWYQLLVSHAKFMVFEGFSRFEGNIKFAGVLGAHSVCRVAQMGVPGGPL